MSIIPGVNAPLRNGDFKNLTSSQAKFAQELDKAKSSQTKEAKNNPYPYKPDPHPAPIKQGRPSAEYPEIRPVPFPSTDYNVGTFNAHGPKGGYIPAEKDQLGKFLKGRGPEGDKKLDIVGFQELEHDHAYKDMKKVMTNAGFSGFKGSEGGALFWDRNKFSSIHTETFSVAGGREINIAVLRDKANPSAKLIVTNSHLDPAENAKGQTNREKAQIALNKKVADLRKQFPGIDARIDVGDFNQPFNKMVGPDFTGDQNTNSWDTKTREDNKRAPDKKNVDYILSEGYWGETSATNNTQYVPSAAYGTNPHPLELGRLGPFYTPKGRYFTGDEHPHPMISQTITVTYDKA